MDSNSLQTYNIWEACSDGNLAKVQEFISSGMYRVDSMDEYGYTPIHAATSYGHLELVQYLLNEGANVNTTDPDGDTPLHVCEDEGVARYLVSLGADPSVQNNEGKNALETALENEAFAVARYFRALLGDTTASNNGNSSNTATHSNILNSNNNSSQMMGDLGEGMIDTTNASPEEIGQLLDAIEEVNNNGMLPEGVQFNLSTTSINVHDSSSMNSEFKTQLQQQQQQHQSYNNPNGMQEIDEDEEMN